MGQAPPKKVDDSALPEATRLELQKYAEWIGKYRAGGIGEIKMQKIRLQLGTYHQRQDGVQMQRIKIPGGTVSADQLIRLADVADKYGSGFLHITTRQDFQIYYIKLEECPDMMRELAGAGITTREACGNTVRNVTCSFRAGIAPSEPFDATPHSQALYEFLVRNKYNQVMGRKFKIAFQSTERDDSGMLFHDLGFKAVVKQEGGRERRGFRTFIGGGLGGVPILGHLYSEFLPEEELLEFAAATVRLFDRYGERKNRMAARMKFLVRKMGIDKFKAALDEERKKVMLPESFNDYLKEARSTKPVPPMPTDLPENPAGLDEDPGYQAWLRDNVEEHKHAGYKGVHVRLKLGDLMCDTARSLAAVAKTFSHSQLRVSMEQNLYLPWAPEKALPALYKALCDIKLGESGAETIEDTTTCPGADTCRLGITSAKGLGQSVTEALNNGLSKYRELARNIKVKVSGCPNGCAQHGIADIGFQGAAQKQEGNTVPSHELFVGGIMDYGNTAFGERMGKFPARNCPKVVGQLLELYSAEKQGEESFSVCMKRVGKERIKELLAPLQEIPSMKDDPDFYKDWGHENEKFATRTGIKGECAGAPVQEKAPVMEDARERLHQAEAFFMHKEYANAQIEAYEAVAGAARVVLYASLIDPFTSEQAIWEFENVFARAGRADQKWLHISEKLEAEKVAEPTEDRAKNLIELAKAMIAETPKIQP
ncbi:MAG: nitrite/sulfite reductase [Candidatus Omnitrophota bacterium]|nr:nitrite/sulfite reductase [Candidatus Omnitrophota bacterium]